MRHIDFLCNIFEVKKILNRGYYLRLLTGSDMIIIENIEVSFSAMEGLARRPIAHTSAPMLKLPNSHRNFCEFREESTSILNARKTGTDSI